MEIARGIHRIGSNSIVNVYLVEEAGEVTIVDAGVPGFYGDLPGELAAMGRAMAEVRALILTHGHTDHIGFADRLRQDRQIPVSVHEVDAALARGEVPNPSKGFGPDQARSVDRVPLVHAPARRTPNATSARGLNLRRRSHPRRARESTGDPDARPHTGKRRLPLLVA